MIVAHAHRCDLEQVVFDWPLPTMANPDRQLRLGCHAVSIGPLEAGLGFKSLLPVAQPLALSCCHTPEFTPTLLLGCC